MRVQPWPPYSGECRPPLRLASIAAALIRSIALLGETAVQALGLLLEGDQLGVDEVARPLLQFRLLLREPPRRGLTP